MSASELLFKIVVLGRSGVGKTSIVRMLIDSVFEEQAISTNGVDYRSVEMEIDGAPVKLMIWDTAGQERYNAITKSYLRGSVGILIVFSLSDASSFGDVQKFIDQAKATAHPHAAFLLIGNKSDEIEKRSVTEQQIQDFATTENIKYMQTSAKTSENISEVFKQLATEVYARVKRNEINLDEPAVEVHKSADASEANKCC